MFSSLTGVSGTPHSPSNDVRASEPYDVIQQLSFDLVRVIAVFWTTEQE